MAKISVRHGIARAYGFLFGRLFRIIGLSWLPAVFYAVAASFLIQRMSGAMQTAVPADDGLLGEYAFAYFFALVMVTAFLGAVIAIPLTREALGRHEEPVAVHFVVGGREFRLFFALLRFYAIETVVLVAMVFAAGIAVTTLGRAGAGNLHVDWAGVPFQTWLNIAAGFVGSLVFLLLATKLGFLLTPVATLEKHAKLGRAAQLSRGNFWRLAFVYVVVGLPATLVLVACETTFGGLEMGKTLPRGMQAFYTVDRDHIALFATILAGGLVVLHALFAGASASAYEELEGGVVYDRAPSEAPARPVPAPAFADMRAHGVSDLRPGDARGSMLREDLASRAASDYSAPLAEAAPAAAPVEVQVQPVEPVSIAEGHEVPPATAHVEAEQAAPTASQEDPVIAAGDVSTTDAHAAVASPAMDIAAQGTNGGSEIRATDIADETPETPAPELPPLDPAAMALAQQPETAPSA
jgi:hypothetical protein